MTSNGRPGFTEQNITEHTLRHHNVDVALRTLECKSEHDHVVRPVPFNILASFLN